MAPQVGFEPTTLRLTPTSGDPQVATGGDAGPYSLGLLWRGATPADLIPRQSVPICPHGWGVPKPGCEGIRHQVRRAISRRRRLGTTSRRILGDGGPMTPLSQIVHSDQEDPRWDAGVRRHARAGRSRCTDYLEAGDSLTSSSRVSRRSAASRRSRCSNTPAR